jgi:transposase
MAPKVDLEPLKVHARNFVRAGRSARFLMRKLSLTHWTARRLWKELANELGIDEPEGRGRPQQLSRAAKLWLKRTALGRNSGNNAELARLFFLEWGIPISRHLVRRVLAEKEIFSKKKIKRALLLDQHKSRRRAWAADKSAWTEEDWSKVIWSDESRVVVGGPDGRIRVHMMKNERWKDKHFQGVERYAKVQCMIWGAFSARGVGAIMWARKNIDGAQYKQILVRGIPATLRKLGYGANEIVFQQDNATVHTTRANLAYLQRKGYKVMDWPSKSPDMNPIENLWGWLKGKLNNLPKARTAEELWDQIQQCWNNIPPELCARLVGSMPRRVACLKSARGGYTRY